MKNFITKVFLNAEYFEFLRATAATAVAYLSHCNSVCLSLCSSVTWVDQSKTVQAKITKFLPSAA